MAATYDQADRPLTVTTPLKDNVLLIRGFSGHEAISQLFRFELDLMAKNTDDVPFEKLLGQKITVHLVLPKGEARHFSGICIRVSQGERDEREKMFTYYRAEIVPAFWMLTRKAQSRIFHQKTVPEILKEVLTGLTPSDRIEGTFQKRDYCVQYRETDFNFASRLMEEEGIYYFFEHGEKNHTMVLANSPDRHKDLPLGPSEIIYEDVTEGTREEDRVFDWAKVQELRSGKYTLWDHTFERPYENLQAEKLIQEDLKVGKVPHKLKVGGNADLEIYDWPGEYAQRFDGVEPGGGDRSSDINNIFQDNKRTVEIRMQEEALGSLLIHGASNCRHFSTGYKFTLKRHFSGEGGPYVLTGISHSARGSGDYRAGQTGAFQYQNEFTCIPVGLPFRPPRLTPKPVIHGTQTAVVVAPSSEEIFTDKYGRVKVKFHWDRRESKDASSSCWIRVGTFLAGKQWGAISIPRKGQEVIVSFLEGDPDQPIITGSLYNADMMPPYKLPEKKTQSGVKTRSTLQGTPDDFNEIRFEDKKGSEQLYLHAERNFDTLVENDETHKVGQNRETTIGNDENVTVKRHRTEHVENGDETITIHTGNRTIDVNTGHDTLQVKTGNQQVDVNTGVATLNVRTSNRDVSVPAGAYQLNAMRVNITASTDLTFKCGAGQININAAGIVTIQGVMIKLN